jgi:aspartate-semialdehyde dehydrogenase
VLALFLARIQGAATLQHASVIAFEPASEHGQAGMDELHQQTVNLLSFQQLPRKVFDVQVAFNLVARYGEESGSKLSTVHDRVLRHYAKISAERLLTPSLLVVQAPTFHSHAFALNLRFENPTEVSSVSAALAGEHISIIEADAEGPNNVNAAGQSDILVSVVPDSSDRSMWLWAASDNLRVAASTAVECAESMAAARPRGQIQ